MARLPKGDIRVMFFEQQYLPENAGGGPLFVLARWNDDPTSREAFLDPGRYPAFLGRAGWFRVRRHKQGVYTFIERVAGKDGEPFVGPW